tara:strand:- start:272 stop:505 length:234 start_codon:yes stop_codon:yes gene_type:complete
MIKYKQQITLKQNSWKFDAKRADKYISYCPSCKTCWELMDKKTWINRRNKWGVVFLVDFPKYGKKTRECPKCLEESQ